MRNDTKDVILKCVLAGYFHNHTRRAFHFIKFQHRSYLSIRLLFLSIQNYTFICFWLIVKLHYIHPKRLQSPDAQISYNHKTINNNNNYECL